MGLINSTHTPVSVDENAPSSSNAFPVYLTDNAGATIAIDGNDRLEVAAYVADISPYAFGDAGGATDKTIPVAAVRDDALSTLADAEGDYTQLRVNSEGALWIAGNITANPESIFVDNSAFTVDTDNMNATGFLVDETTPGTVTEGNVGVARMTADRKLLARVVGATDANRLDINGDGEALVDLASISTSDTLNVTFTEPGTAVNDAQDDINVSTVTPVNHDVAAGAGGLKVLKVTASASAPAMIEVYQYDGVSTETLVDRKFISRQQPNVVFEFDDLVIPNGDEVRVKKISRWGTTHDINSLIQGRQL